MLCPAFFIWTQHAVRKQIKPKTQQHHQQQFSKMIGRHWFGRSKQHLYILVQTPVERLKATGVLCLLVARYF